MEGFAKLEPDYEPAFTAWKQKADPTTTGTLLPSLSPVIDKGVSVYAGGAAGPTTKSHARRMALQAIRTYDPARRSSGRT